MTTSRSPYSGVPEARWAQRTKELIRSHPLGTDEIVEVVLSSWESIFASAIGRRRFAIGKHISPKPQIMGFLLHELIPLEFSARHPDEWRIDKTGADKDLVHLRDPHYSVEIKTSSHPTQVYGNRSYAQRTAASKKSKSGFYLTANFESFKVAASPTIRIIRFGWLDHSDWTAQSAPTGQQARLQPVTYKAKLLPIYTA